MHDSRSWESVDRELLDSERRSSTSTGHPSGSGKREVDLYIRTYMTLLESSGASGVSSLEPAHLNAAPSLHAGASETEPDLNALIYSAQRLPSCILNVRQILLGQNEGAFARAGYENLYTWSTQSAPGRRRKWLYDGNSTLAAYIASTSDLDDLIPSIVAYQIECNKIHRILNNDAELVDLIETAREAASNESMPEPATIRAIGERLLISPEDWARLRAVWGESVWSNLLLLAAERKRFTLQMIGGTYIGYNRSTRQWWRPVEHKIRDLDLQDRPVYFVSSNTHSLVNTLAGTAQRRKDELTQFIRHSRHPELMPELEALEAGRSRSSWENLLYFAARHYFSDDSRERERLLREKEEHERGIIHLSSNGAVDVGVQVIDLGKLDAASIDPRLLHEGEHLDPSRTDAIVVNINYPLGLSAYHIMTQVAMSTSQLRGVYVLGKAATLNGRIGDVMIANVVYDEHSGNTYWLDNCFSYGDLAPYLVYGAALDNQKAVTVKGTYLQNQGYLDFYYRENFTVVEMEAGPFLNALFEDLFMERYPDDEAINLAQHSAQRIDIGVIHYASDTPYTRAQTLGARGLSYHGMDSTYASTLAILRRIFQQTGVLQEGSATVQ
jgi:hypothetical protein